jgi:FkbM family methyltransferase
VISDAVEKLLKAITVRHRAQKGKIKMKQLARSAIKAFIKHAPWGVRNAFLEACINSLGLNEVSARLLPRLGIAEIGVWGELGLIRSAWNDRQILGTYARTGGAETGIVGEIVNFFGNEPGTYIDVGANIGLTTIPIAQNPLIRCLAFEPEPGNFRFLKLNVEVNVPNNSVEFFQNAVLHTRGVVSLAIADGNLGDHRVTKDGIPGRPTVEVSAIPLDDVLDRVKGRLAVKIDTQGAEPSIVVGGRQVLDRAGLLAMEFCPYLMRQLGGNPEVVIDLIGSFDQVALAEPESCVPLLFENAPAAQESLRAKVRTARDSDSDYLDIIAHRSMVAKQGKL